MKYIKTFEKTKDVIISFYIRFNIINDNFKNMIESVEFLKSAGIDYEIYVGPEDINYVQYRYLLYAFIKNDDFYNRNLLDGERFILDAGLNIKYPKIKDVNDIKDIIKNSENWNYVSNDEFDLIINTNKYNL